MRYYSLFFFLVFLIAVPATFVRASSIYSFGGKIIPPIIPCTAGPPGSMLFTIKPGLQNPLSGGTYLFVPGFSHLFMWWQPPIPGINYLGIRAPGGCCWIFIPSPVGPIPICLPTQWTLIRAGTSLFPTPF